MADELQALLDRVRAQAVEAARAQAEQLLARAREDAERVVREAEARAESTRSAAEADARTMADRGRAAVQHAARDLLLTLGRRIEDLVERVLASEVERALDERLVERLLLKIVEAHGSEGAERIELLVGPEDRDRLVALVRERLRGELARGVELQPDPGIRNGFKVALDGGRVVHDYTAEALAASLAAFLRPSIAAIVHAAALELR